MAEQPECSRCARPIHDGAGICTRCAAALAEALRGVPGLVDDLLITLAKQDQLTSGAGSGSEQPLPLRLDIPDAVWVLGNVLTVWARDVAELAGLRVDARHLTRPVFGAAADPWPPRGIPRTGAHPGPRCPASDLPPTMCAHCIGHRAPRSLRPDDQVTVLHLPVAPLLGWRPPTTLDSLRFAATWLAEHTTHLRRLPAIDQAHDELTDALDQAGKACSAPPLRVFVGGCETCDADLYGWPDHRAIRCGRCATAYTDMRDRWDSALLRLRYYPATAATIARLAGELYGTVIHRGTINVWHHRRRITAVDDDAHGDPRFRIGDVLDLARRAQTSKAS